ncbi:hypothetical protein VTK56DRAFT_6071 [Thermocarpiscus australiensis]
MPEGPPADRIRGPNTLMKPSSSCNPPEEDDDEEIQVGIRRRSTAKPIKFEAVTDVEKGLQLREHSYAHPLDVQMNKAIPINVPPVDALFNLRLHSVPVVSLSVLTPTEIRRLQRDYHDMRNLVLSRIKRCLCQGCNTMIPVSKL